MRPEEEVESTHVLHTFLVISTINIHLKWRTRVYSFQKMENNSWLIRPEEEVVSAHVLLTFDVRLQRCQLLNLWKKHIFSGVYLNNVFRFSSVQMTGMLHFDGSGFPGASLHIVRASLFWQNRYFIFRSQSKNVTNNHFWQYFHQLDKLLFVCDTSKLVKANLLSGWGRWNSSKISTQAQRKGLAL